MQLAEEEVNSELLQLMGEGRYSRIYTKQCEIPYKELTFARVHKGLIKSARGEVLQYMFVGSISLKDRLFIMYMIPTTGMNVVCWSEDVVQGFKKDCDGKYKSMIDRVDALSPH